MIKYTLRKYGYSAEEKIPNKHIIVALWVAITVLLTGAAFFIIFNIGAPLRKNSGDGLMTFDIMEGMAPFYILDFVFFILVYFILKFLLTLLFCSDRYNNVKFKFIEDKGFPICHCKEALKIWQTVVIYAIPAVIVYVSMFWVSIATLADPFQIVELGLMTMLFFMSFFIAFDLTLVVCVLFFKTVYKINYISVDKHIYKMTVYKGTYFKSCENTEKNVIKAEKNTIERQTRIKMNTCLNKECENYALEFEKSVKICPLCGGFSYKSEVYIDVLTCVNNACGNYELELKNDTVICELCGAKTKPFVYCLNHQLKKPVFILIFITTVAFPFLFLYMNIEGIEGGILYKVLDYLRFSLIFVSIFIGFHSRNKAAFLSSLASLPLSTAFVTLFSLLI